MPSTLRESDIEEAALDWFASLGYQVVYGPTIEPDQPAAERQDFREVVLAQRLQDALARLNPHLPAATLEEACRKVIVAQSPSLAASNRAFHRMLVDGVPVEYRAADGRIVGALARLVDFDHPDANDWLAVNQFTVIENHFTRRPDIVVFVNGLPLGAIELKNAGDANATIWSAFNQLQTYKQQVPALFAFNEALVISDGLQARIGTLTADRERFMPWRTIAGEQDGFRYQPITELEVLLRGVFDKRRLLDLLRYFVVYEDDGRGALLKKMAGYHQFHAVNRAVEETVGAASLQGDRRIGVVWHTQGSGKSLTMGFYAGRLATHPAMQNPTIVVLTDRNDLDGQLFDSFSLWTDILRQKPVQAGSREELQKLLQVASGGIVFTTIQKFFPEQKGGRYPLLSDRRNIVVIADEAHRSQYDFIDGFARHMRDALPNASFIGFTGTPIELSDKNTRAVFGDYISVYDIQRAVEDGATVPIYYESRLARLDLKEGVKPWVDEQFDDVTEGEEVESREKLKTKWAALEALVGDDQRIARIAQDLVDHFETRQAAMEGKAMVVCMSRRICVALYDALVKLRPDWHAEDDEKGALKIVMTGAAADPLDWQTHIRNKPRREELAKRFKNPDDPFRIVIVRDMWLTGFDAPCLHTMYVDKPMQGHGLMQAISRVNRVFRDKPGGLVVDYLGLAENLRRALADYTAGGGAGDTAVDVEVAVALLRQKYEICRGIIHGFDWSGWTSGKAAVQLNLMRAGQDYILGREDGKSRWMKAVSELSKAFALAVPHEYALSIRDDVGFFQAVRAALAKAAGADGRYSPDEMEHAIRQIISQAIVSNEVVDIFAAAGLKKPDISILSDEFLAEVRDLPQRNLAVEVLAKLLNDEIKARMKKNLVQSRSFAEMLEQSVRAYQNRAVEAAQVIEELIALAKEMRAAQQRGERLNLSEDEIAFYDALEVNDSAVKVLGDETLKTIARELVDTVRNNVTIDWTVRENVRAKLRVMVKRILRKYGYPPDKQEKATQTVLEQAELIARDWAG
ncbi:MAG: type I restriction endonuclease subunit R [Chloroflexi bacterium]|nr:type I restriction endonuclease subunit R [Chloroflexota bacterium]